MLKTAGGQAFTVENLETRTGSFVYLVELLTFEEIASGVNCFKIGKATSIPSRRKQFARCQLMAHEAHADTQTVLQTTTDQDIC